MSDPLVRVFGTYQDAAGRPMTGSVTFTPDIYAPDDTPGTALKSQQKVVARLDSQGYFEVELTASDDAGWRTDGVSIPYRVDERVPGIDRQRLVFVLKPGPVDLNTQPDAPIDYDGPVEVPVPGLPGPQGEVSVGSTATGEPGTDAEVTDSDPSPNRAVLNFVIPRGADSMVPGPPNELAIGTVSTLPPGSQATAEITGTSPAQTLSLGIPTGATGADSTVPGPQGEVAVDSTVTGAPGTEAQVEDLDPSPNRALLKFTIPRGDVGATGPAIGGILTTKGDLVARDATTAVRVPVGSAGQVLTPDPATPTGVKWGNSVQVTHPNTDDVLAQVWDSGKNRWQTIHYDSGWRDMGAALATPANWTSVNAKWRRIGGFVEVIADMTVAAGASIIGTGSTGTLWATSGLSGFRLWGIQFVEFAQVKTGGVLYPAEVYGIGYNISAQFSGTTFSVGSLLRLRLRYPLQSDAIPTSLPGTLVSPAPAFHLPGLS